LPSGGLGGVIRKGHAGYKAASVQHSTKVRYLKQFQFWTQFLISIDYPAIPWIDDLDPEDQSMVFSWFAVACAEQGHNAKGKGNNFRTYSSKKSAIKWCHKYFRKRALDLSGPELHLVEQGYRKTKNKVHPKKAFTVNMLLKCMVYFDRTTTWGVLKWNCMVLSFFYLCRGGEMWITSGEADHRILYRNLTFYDKDRRILQFDNLEQAERIAVKFVSSKTIHDGRNEVIEFAKSGHHSLCPVNAGRRAVRARLVLEKHGRTEPEDATLSAGTKSTEISKIIKKVVMECCEDPKDYALHSIRIGGATALFEAGYDDVVVKLAGRWSSWCSELYTRISGRVMESAASGMIFPLTSQ